jgi:hypothetical protein
MRHMDMSMKQVPGLMGLVASARLLAGCHRLDIGACRKSRHPSVPQIGRRTPTGESRLLLLRTVL